MGSLKTTLLRWFHSWGSPRWFYERSRVWGRVLGGLAALFIPVALVWGLLYAPPDYQQGNSFRIIYLHVPSAMIAQSAYLLMAAVALAGYVWRLKIAGLMVRSIAPVGASFCFLALFTGAVWGKPTWGTWWEWDARLTSMLLLMFLYLGLIALDAAIRDRLLASRAVSILLWVGVLNVPVIKYSVEIWNTLHQPATFRLTEKPPMPPSMYLPLLVAVIGMYSLFGYSLLLRARNAVLLQNWRSHWVRSLLREENASAVR